MPKPRLPNSLTTPSTNPPQLRIEGEGLLTSIIRCHCTRGVEKEAHGSQESGRRVRPAEPTLLQIRERTKEQSLALYELTTELGKEMEETSKVPG